MPNNRKYFINQVHEVPSGKFKIVELDKNTYKHATVIWLKDGNTQRIRLDVISTGSIKNPMYPSVCGVGYVGIGDYSTSNPYRDRYNSWASMLARCHREKLKDKYTTYSEATCDASWLNYQNYCEFYESCLYRQSGWSLDKDLLILGNKHYSKENCVYLPNKINTAALSLPKTTKTHGYRGVSPCHVSGKWMSTIKVTYTKAGHTTGGRFSDIKDAARNFLKHEIIHLSSIISEYCGVIDPRAIDALRYRIKLIQEECDSI